MQTAVADGQDALPTRTQLADIYDAEETDDGRARAIDAGPLAGAQSKEKTGVGRGPPARHTAGERDGKCSQESTSLGNPAVTQPAGWSKRGEVLHRYAGEWLLNQFGVRQSTWHPYNEVFLLVQDVMSRAPSSATGQSYSATGHGHG